MSTSEDDQVKPDMAFYHNLRDELEFKESLYRKNPLELNCDLELKYALIKVKDAINAFYKLLNERIKQKEWEEDYDVNRQ